MGKSLKIKHVMIASCSILGLLGPHAFAQTTGADQGAGALEVVTVTAERRAENIQKVPIAITAVTAEQVLKQGVLRTDQLAAAVPGLVFSHEINGATPFLRGVGPNSNGTGEEGSVALYLDDLYIEQSDAAIFRFSDIDSIEVLKGPQGTLFGRNATGGVVQIHTKNPTDDPELDAHLGYGNYDTWSGDIYATGAITDTLSANFSAFGYDEAQGWGKDLTTGQRAFTEEDFGGRMKFLWTPLADTTVLLALGHTYTQGEVGSGFNQLPGSTGLPGTYFAGWYNTLDAENDNSINRHDDISLRVEHDLGWSKLVSISGWQEMNGVANFDQDGAPGFNPGYVLNGTYVGQTITALQQVGRDWSEELQLLSPDDNSQVKWIGGFFYFHDISGYNGAKLAGSTFGFPTDMFPQAGDNYINLNSQVTTQSLAGFGQATYTILPGTDITGGLRYTNDVRDYRGQLSLSPSLGGFPISGVPCGDTLCPYTQSKNYGQWSYRGIVDQHFTDDIMAYVSYNRGFKSGQYDTFGTAASGPIATPPVRPEVLEATEGGLKTDWLNNSLQMNLDAFYYTYTNIQFAVIVPGGTELINAAGAIIKGVEGSLSYAPTNRLTFSGSFSLQKGKYTSFANAPDYFIPGCSTTGAILCVTNAAGNDTIQTPHFSGNLGVDYVVPSSIGDFDLNTSYSYTSSYQFRPDYSLPQRVTGLLSASVLWTSTTGRWDLRFWGNNLGNVHYYSYGSETFGLGKQFSPAEPRTYGITAGVHL